LNWRDGISIVRPLGVVVPTHGRQDVVAAAVGLTRSFVFVFVFDFLEFAQAQFCS